MPGMFLNFPFDEELFLYQWQNAQDPVLTAMLNSGAVQSNDTIKRLIQNGSDTYTIPFYNVIGGDDENYDGKTDITLTDVDAAYQSGIVYGRAHGWKERDFVVDYNSGADPMKQITSQVNQYWVKKKQKRLIGIADALFGITNSAGWKLHTTDLTAADTDISNKGGNVAATTISEAIQKAVGDHADQFSLAVMHSKVATNLAGLDLLEYRKYTDPSGIQRLLRIADINGMTVIIDDGVPTTTKTDNADATFTTYLFGIGAFQTAPANCEKPSEITRNPTEGGGYNALITRVRETIHPNGFTFTKPKTGYTSSPTDAQLGTTGNWSIAVDPKTIAMARIISKG